MPGWLRRARGTRRGFQVYGEVGDALLLHAGEVFGVSNVPPAAHFSAAFISFAAAFINRGQWLPRPLSRLIERGSRHHVVSETAVTLVGCLDWGVGFVGLRQTFVRFCRLEPCLRSPRA